MAELNIRDLALIERQRVPFHSGFNVISGETGAGKSLVLEALRFVLGARASHELVRHGAKACAVEALFYVDRPEERARLHAILGDLPGLEDGELVLSRTLNKRGRSRATVNGRLIPMATLREFGAELCELSSQHDAQTLFKEPVQRELLDGYGGHIAIRTAYQEAYGAHRRIVAELEHALGGAADHDARLLALEDELETLDELGPEPGEAASVEAELRVLENAGTLRDSLGRAFAELSDCEGAAVEIAGAHAQALFDVAALLPAAQDLAEQLDAATGTLQTVAFACRTLAEGLDVNPERAVFLSQRLGELHRASRRFGVAASGLSARHEAVRAEVVRLHEGRDGVESLEIEREARLRALLTRGEALTSARRDAAERLSAAVTEEIGALGLAGARFTIAFREEAPSRFGLDGVSMMFGSNEGHEARPLRKVASGGEASRVMLALRTLLAGRGSVPTLVFDEVDAGVGGRLGAVIGQKLRQLGERYQVLTITHLAQVAAYAEHHLTVAKSAEVGRTLTTVSEIDGERRVQEIAHMLRGDQLTEHTLGEAQAMVDAARGATA